MSTYHLVFELLLECLKNDWALGEWDQLRQVSILYFRRSKSTIGNWRRSPYGKWLCRRGECGCLYTRKGSTYCDLKRNKRESYLKSIGLFKHIRHNYFVYCQQVQFSRRALYYFRTLEEEKLAMELQ